MLSGANLSCLETEARDKDGHSPNECFLRCRSAHCAVARSSIDLERQCWVMLMQSARRQAEVSPFTAVEDEETGQKTASVRSKHRRSDSLSSCGTSCGTISDEEYVDAFDGNKKED